jgi:excisionase family DNA binding protein
VTSVDAAIQQAVQAAVDVALAPLMARIAEPVPLVYTTQEAATALGVSRNVIARWCNEGVLPTMPHTDRRLIPRAAVERLVAEADR